MNRWWMSLAVLSLVAAAGCGQKYSSSCKKAVDLTSPFTELGLPTGDGRVCESDDKKAKLEFIGKDEEKWRGKIEESVLAAGFVKESCPSYCVYTRGTQRLQVIIGDVADKWVTASLIMSAGRDRGGATPAARADAPAATPAPAAGGATSVDSIPQCRSYFTKLLACPPGRGPMTREKEAEIKKRELQEKLDKGRSSTPGIVATTCENFEKSLRCN
jgi:hypothetical protein